jgi:hypothetical protein
VEATTGSTQSPPSTSTKTSAAQYFLKGVRRNVADCTKFKEAKHWQRWERHLQSTATAQGVEQVFDPKYVPTTAEDTELFYEKQKFGYQVLEQTVQTQEGMTIGWEYSKTKDAQSVHAKLIERCGHSQAATLAQDAPERELGELRLDTTWKKGCVPFMVAFKNRVMDLENYRGPSNTIMDHEQRTWLSRSPLMHAEMRRAFGNLESNEVPLASALPTAPGAGPPNKLPFHELHACMLDQAHKIDASVKQTAKESRRVHEAESSRPPPARGGRHQGRGFGRGRGRGRGSSVPCIEPEKWATMTWEEKQEHHKKRFASINAAINRAKNQPQSAKDDTVDEQKQDQQEQVVDRVPTEIMSVITTPPTPAPPGSVIRSILSSNSNKKKKTESVTTPPRWTSVHKRM